MTVRPGAKNARRSALLGVALATVLLSGTVGATSALAAGDTAGTGATATGDRTVDRAPAAGTTRGEPAEDTTSAAHSSAATPEATPTREAAPDPTPSPTATPTAGAKLAYLPGELPIISADIAETTDDHMGAALTVNLTRVSSTQAISGYGFTFTLPAGLVVHEVPSNSPCGGTVTGEENDTSFALVDGTQPIGEASCGFTVFVKAAQSGSYQIQPSDVSDETTGMVVEFMPDTLVVETANPTLGATFTPPNVMVGVESVLDVIVGYTDENPAASRTGIVLAGTLPNGIEAAGAGTTDTCGGSLSVTAGATTFDYTGGTLSGAAAECHFELRVTPVSSGYYEMGYGAITGEGVSYVGTRGCQLSSCWPELEATRKPQEITFTQQPNVTLADGPVPVSPTASSELPVEVVSTTTAVCEVQLPEAMPPTPTTFLVALLGAGTCTLSATQAGDKTWWEAAEAVEMSFEVAAATQVITFAQPADVSVADSPVTITPTASSALPVTVTSATTDVCEVLPAAMGDPTPQPATVQVSLLAHGTCTLHADQEGDKTFEAAERVTRSFAVNPLPQTIDFTPPQDVQVDAATTTVSATASSGLPVTFDSDTPTVCQPAPTTNDAGASTREIQLLTVGTCEITASQGGDPTYAAATDVTRAFEVTRVPQTVEFTVPGTVKVTALETVVTATAQSGLPVTFHSATAAVCDVAGEPSTKETAQPSTATITLKSAGTCTLHAEQGGDDVWAPAEQVTKSFTVTGPDPVTDVEAVGGEVRLLVSWQAPADTTGVTGYRATAYRVADGTATGSTCETDSATTLDCFMGAEADVPHTVTVVARTAVGDSAAVESDEATPYGPTPPATPPAVDPNEKLTTTDGDITTAVPGQDVTFIGYGFLPYSTVVITIYSDPIVLGTTQALGDGTFSKPVTIPPGLAAGGHLAVAQGLNYAGLPRSMGLDIQVAPTAAAPPSATPPATTTPSAALAVTGPGVVLTLLIGAALTTAGSGLVLVTRRRRTA